MNHAQIVENDAEHARLYAKVKARVETGEERQAEVLRQVSQMVIRDKLVAPTQMKFSGGDNLELLAYYANDPEKTFTIHRHALGQIAGKDRVKIDMEYVNRMLRAKEAWRTDLIAHMLSVTYGNTDFRNKRDDNPKFLHRIVGQEIRGFVSRRFNRHIASAPLLRAFLEVCGELGAAPFDASASDVKFAVKCAIPYVFEPVKNEFIAIGIEWSNSDFGAGRMQVALCLWMPRGDRFSVFDQVLFRRHIGSIIEESDIEISDETAQKEAAAQASAIRDTVREQLSEKNIDIVLRTIELASQENIPWATLKGQFSRFLSRENLKTLEDALEQDIIDLPPVKVVDEEKMPTRWWATQALSWLATRTTDMEKKLELERASSGFLEVK